MACSRFEYVKKFEDDDRLLPGCWVVVRLDGRNFTNFCKHHSLAKPNDEGALRVMNAAGGAVMNSFRDAILAYGQSDEYSIVFRRETALFNRRRSKILSCVVSLFTSAYVLHWSRYMKIPLQSAPSFDARVVLYPTTKHLRDYLSWRQADVHVNNLYNTTFWALVLRGGMSNVAAEHRLKGTLASDKNEILFSEFGINYNNECAMFRKGTTIIRTANANIEEEDVEQWERQHYAGLQLLHVDIIGDQFWNTRPHLLSPPDTHPPRIRG